MVFFSIHKYHIFTFHNSYTTKKERLLIKDSHLRFIIMVSYYICCFAFKLIVENFFHHINRAHDENYILILMIKLNLHERFIRINNCTLHFIILVVLLIWIEFLVDLLWFFIKEH